MILLIRTNLPVPMQRARHHRFKGLAFCFAGLAGLPSGVQACSSGGNVQPAAQMVQQADAGQIAALLDLKGRGMKLLTFVGYSAAGYEEPAAMLAIAAQELSRHDPARTLVNIGGTAAGIGAVYGLAKERGFGTVGIVSTLARDGGETLSPCVDRVFFVPDTQWGGLLPGSTSLSPTSAAIVALSDEIVAIGGGNVARDEVHGARQAGKPVLCHAADMNHRIALDKASAHGQPPPTDFSGAVCAAPR